MKEFEMADIKAPLLERSAQTMNTFVHKNEEKDTNLVSAFKKLEQDIEAQFFPSVIETPFPPRNAYVTSDLSSYVLVSTNEKACYLSESDSQNPFMIDISTITNRECRHGVLINDSEIIIAEAGSNFYRVDLQNVTTVFHQSNCNNFKTFKVANNSLYVLDIFCLRIYNLDNNEFQKKSFWPDLESRNMDVKADGEEHVVAVTTKARDIIVYDLNSDTELVKMVTKDLSESIKITKQFLACAYNDETKLWTWGTWEEFRTIKITASFACIDINQSETLLAGALSNGNVAVWSLLSSNLLPQIFAGCSGPLQEVTFKTDSSVFYFSPNESKLYLREIGNFPQVYAKEIQTCQVKSIHYLEEQDKIILNIKDQGMVVYYAQNLDLVLDAREGDDLNILLNHEQTKILREFNNSQSKSAINSIVDPISLRTLTSKSFTNYSSAWQVTALTNRKGFPQMIQSFANGRLGLITYDLQVVKGTTIHTCVPTAIASFNSGDAVVSGDIEGNVIIYNLITYVTQGVFEKHVGAICAIEISQDDTIVICASRDGVIRISDTSTKVCIASLKGLNSPFIKLYLTENQHYLLGACEENYFCIWDFETKTMIARKDGYNNFLVFKNEMRLCLVSSDEITVMDNPLTSKNICVLGNSPDKLEFFSYIRSFFKNKTPAYKPEFNNYLIAPYFFNALHFFASYNCVKLLRKSLSTNSFLVRSESGHSPLSICVSSQSSLMNDLIDYLITKMEKNKEISVFFQGQLTEINRIGSEHLKRLYVVLFKQLKLKQLPDFCSEAVQLPIYKMTENTYKLQVDEFFDRSLTEFDKPIEFNQFLVKLNLTTGSSEGIEFLESLVESPNEEIFRTPFISLMLNKKWKRIRLIMLGQGIVYYLYLILLIIYISYVHTNLCLMVTLIISCLLTFYEMWQMFTMKLEYFKSVINIVDILRAIFFILYSVVCFTGEWSEYTDALIVAVVLLSFVRGITFFNLFGPTRYMAFLIGEVFKDMVSFAIVLFYSIVSIAVLYMSLKSDKGEMDVFEMVLSSYTLSLGDFNLDEFNFYEKIIFTAASILNTIVMLNLLISILGDTYGRVQEGLEQTDRKEIANMIIEVEKLFIWKRSQGEKMHFTVCMDEGNTEEEEELEGKIQAVIEEVRETNKLVQEKCEATEKLIREKCESSEKLVNEKCESTERIVKEEIELTREMLMKEIRVLTEKLNSFG